MEGNRLNKKELLLNGQTIVTKEYGNSMIPILYSGQQHRLFPIGWKGCQKGDIVYCKVNGRFYTHLVKAVNEKRGVLIGNNRGGTNGWTKNVYGKVIEIFPQSKF